MIAGGGPRRGRMIPGAARWVGAAIAAFAWATGATAQEALPGAAGADTLPPAPPRAVQAVDTPNDRGMSITITWELSADDGAGAGDVREYRIQRAEAGQGEFTLVGTAPAGSAQFEDGPHEGHEVRNGVPYLYRVAAFDGAHEASAAAAGPATSRGNWFRTDRWNVLIILAGFTTFFLLFIRFTRRGRFLFVRKIPGLIAMEEAVGRATEMGKPVLYIPGVLDVDNIQTIASMAILVNVARMVAEYDIPLIVPLNRAFLVPLAEESVRQGYLDAGRPDAFNRDNIRYLSDEQFAFTAAVNGIMIREHPAANIYLGAFFAESLIISEVGFSTGAIQIAGTANIHQLPFFVVACDYTLIGEEFYAASGYISQDPKLLGPLKGADVMKAAIMAIIIVGSILEAYGITAFTRWFVVQ